MITFLLIGAVFPLWMLIPFGIVWMISRLTKRSSFDVEASWQELINDEGFYRKKSGEIQWIGAIEDLKERERVTKREEYKREQYNKNNRL
tara:strand:+ start:295 stop:564 length:270 start_codon:yes stop_codon:yes gene_type:complete